jgi:hypothetical protein
MATIINRIRSPLQKIKRLTEEKKQEDTCDHEFKIFKQTLRPDNEQFHGVAYFKVKACIKCKDKQYLDYTVEK